MKSVNRKIVLMALLGLVLVGPFLLIASIVGIHAATIAANSKPEVFCILLALASIAARMSDGRLSLANSAKEHVSAARTP